MKLKGLAVTVVILAVLSAIAFWANRAPPAAADDPRVGQSLGDPTAIEKAAQIRLSDQGKTIVLTRAPDGSWRDTSYFDLPADFSKLSGFAGDLVTAKIQRLVTTNPDRISRLEFKDTQIEFLDAAGRALWSVTLGKSPESGSGRFVRFEGEDKAYLANLSAWIDTDPKNWANAQLLDLKPDDVAKVEVTFDQGGTVAVARAKKDAPWTADKSPAGQKPSADKISALLSTLGTLRFSDTSDSADPAVAAAKRHLRTVTLTSFNGQTTLIAMGRKPEEKKPAVPAGPVYVFITSSSANAPINSLKQKRAFQVDEYTFTSLPQKPGDLFETAK
jgi:hypothetical protein